MELLHCSETDDEDNFLGTVEGHGKNVRKGFQGGKKRKCHSEFSECRVSE
jgi:hypothetical protein